MRLSAALLLVLMLLPFSARSAQQATCLTCHAKLKQNKVVHPALEMGCEACHTGIDATKVPHKHAGNVPHGLSADQPELCYGCHDKAAFTKATVHAAIGMGCTGCHNPHSSPNAKLLVSEPPDLCFTCHDKTEFTKRVVHPPVAAGMCLSCHSSHSSDEMALLLKRPYELCLDCHPDIPKQQHAISGFGSGKHPLGALKKNKKTGVVTELKDPTRPDKPFYCGSCHNPHSSEGGRLFRFKAMDAMSLCSNCHKM